MSLAAVRKALAMRRFGQRLREEKAARRATQVVIPEHILDFIPWANPGWQRPEHLSGVAKQLERAFTEELDTFATMPPRHGKSELLLHSIGWGLRKYPETPILYATHTATFAAKQSKRAKKLARAAGVSIERGSDRADEWYTEAGGGLVARGVGGEVTGRGFKVIIIDDPFKSREQAESKVYRDKIYDWLTDDVLTRGTPDAATIVVHTRWHPDDVIGRLLADGWDGTVLRAIAEEGDDDGRQPGEALWPGFWPVGVLEKRRRKVGEYGWASLYQGRPRPRGGKVFGPPTFFSELPERYRRGYGVDLAYTAKSVADHSVCVEMLRVERKNDEPLFYIVHVLAKQEEAPTFAARLKGRQAGRPGPMLFLAHGSEKGGATFVEKNVPRFKTEAAVGDKFVRAQDYAAAWNDGRVLLPDPAIFEEPGHPIHAVTDGQWISSFLDVHDGFTGVNDKRDDEVDAGASAFELLNRTASTVKVGQDRILPF